jgi:HSP20 family molecular chaperone IbpA
MFIPWTQFDHNLTLVDELWRKMGSERVEPAHSDAPPGYTARRQERVTTMTPPVDIYENKDEILLLIDLPGVEPAGLKIRFDHGELTLEASRTGRRAADFARRFQVPGGIEAGKIDARLDNGVLELHLPKAESAKPREIPVRAH